jgi:hypothetical protein
MCLACLCGGTAKALGVSVPLALQASADEVIE